MLLGILNYLAGYRRIGCEAKETSVMINRLMSDRIDYWALTRRQGGELTFCLTEKEYRRLTRDGTAPPHVTRERRGLPRLLSRYRRRIGIPIGLILFLLLTRLSTRFIWEVTVSGNETMSDTEITEALAQLGCGIGTYIPSVDFYGICHRFLLENERVSWISVNMVGTTAEVRLIEASPRGTPENGNGTPSNLIARCGGEIVRTETAAGKTVVTAGETVGKGQLLVSGVVTVGREDTGRFVLVRSRAKILAVTERSLSVTVPLVSVRNEVVGRETVGKTLIFFGKPIKLAENSSILPGECDIIKEKRRIVLLEGDRLTGGIPLPIVLTAEYREIREKKTVRLTEEEALAEAEKEMSRRFAEDWAGAEILARTVTKTFWDNENGGEVTLTWTVTAIENIAEEAPIGTK